MKAQLEQRLGELRTEYESGQKILKDIELKLSELEDRKKVLSETLLRISGAIDLLEEVLEEKEGTQGSETTTGLKTASGSVEVPSVIRQSLDEAIKNLEDSGLIAGEIVEQKGVLPIGVMVGEVLRQEPKPGTNLPAGSPVKLIIASRGKFVPPLDRRSACSTLSDRD
jgi:predicted nuclease with TOPRIM domain